METQNWKAGKNGGCVVSDVMPKRSTYSAQDFESEKEYYGGYLIAESIPDPITLKVIIAAPELLKAAEALVADYGFQFIMANYYSEERTANSNFVKIVNNLQAAIKKAT